MKKKALYKKWMSMLLAGVVTTTGFMGGTVTLRAAETTNWIGDEGLSGTADAPKPDDVVPDANQFRPLINDFLRKMAKFRHQENQDVSAGTRIRFFIDKPAAMISFPRAVIKYL